MVAARSLLAAGLATTAFAVPGNPNQAWIKSGDLLKYKANPAYCASVREGKAGDGADVILWHCSKSDRAFQWTFDGQLVRYKADPAYCMSPREGRAGDGTDIILWRCDTDDEIFKWDFSDDHLKFQSNPRYWVSVRKDTALDGADLILWSGYGTGFLWNVKEPVIQLKADPNLCIGVHKSNVGAGSHVVLTECSSLERHTFRLKGDLIQSMEYPQYCLSVREGDFKDGQDVIMWNCADSAPFQWTVALNGRIKSKAYPEYCLMTETGKPGEGFMKHGKEKTLKTAHCDAHEDGITLTHNANYWNEYRGTNDHSQVWIYENEQLKPKVDARYCVTVGEAKEANGHELMLWHCSHDEKTQSKWIIEGQYIKLKQNPRFCASVREGKGGDGSDIILWECPRYADKAFLWDISEAVVTGGKREEHIRWAQNPKLLMSVRGGHLKDGNTLIMWSGWGSPFQWTIVNQLIRLKVDPSLCLSVREGKIGDGSNTILWECEKSDDAFNFKVKGDQIVYAADDRYCLGVREGDQRAQDGADIILWSCGRSISQQFEVDGERIRFKAKPNYCVSVREGKAGLGSDIILWTCDQKKPDADDEL